MYVLHCSTLLSAPTTASTRVLHRLLGASLSSFQARKHSLHTMNLPCVVARQCGRCTRGVAERASRRRPFSSSSLTASIDSNSGDVVDERPPAAATAAMAAAGQESAEAWQRQAIVSGSSGDCSGGGMAKQQRVGQRVVGDVGGASRSKPRESVVPARTCEMSLLYCLPYLHGEFLTFVLSTGP